MKTHLRVVSEEPVDDLFTPRNRAPLGDLAAIGPSATSAARALGSVLSALERYRVGDEAILLSLEGLSPESRALLGDALGEGEVALVVRGTHLHRILETVLPGLWRVRQMDASGELVDEFLEVADVPSVVRAAALEATRSELELGPTPDGVTNALSVLAEIQHHMRSWEPGQPNHVVPLTLLPMSPEDLRFLRKSLGRGPVQGESRGYGPCRVELTGSRRVWVVQYRTSLGRLVLETLEVGDVPVSLKAAAEDLEDSATRLAALLGES